MDVKQHFIIIKKGFVQKVEEIEIKTENHGLCVKLHPWLYIYLLNLPYGRIMGLASRVRTHAHTHSQVSELARTASVYKCCVLTSSVVLSDPVRWAGR